MGSFDQQLMLSLMLQLMAMITIIIGLMMIRMMIHAHSNGDGGSMDHPSASFQMNHLDNGHFAKEDPPISLSPNS